MKKRLLMYASALLLTCGTSVQAATFALLYDSVDDGMIVPGDVIGGGIFSYDGPIIPGSFLLSDLTGVSYFSTLAGSLGTTDFSGPPFDPADLSLVAISVTAVGGGEFEMIFTGESAGTTGSLDIITPSGLLSHEPEMIGVGAVGPRAYFAVDGDAGLDAFGDYMGFTTTVIPEPATTLLLCCTGALAGLRRRRR